MRSAFLDLFGDASRRAGDQLEAVTMVQMRDDSDLGKICRSEYREDYKCENIY